MGLLPIGGEVTDGTMLFNGQDLRTYLSLNGELYVVKTWLIFQDSGSALDPIVRIGKQFRELFKSHIEITNDECDRRAIELLESVSLLMGQIYCAVIHMSYPAVNANVWALLWH